MKRLFIILSCIISFNAIPCTLIVPQPPGGTTDFYARTMQKINKDIIVEYKPGAYMSSAINYIENNKGFAIINVPSYYSTQNPKLKEHLQSVEPIRFILSSDQSIVTNKNLSFDQLLSGPINIGVPFFGGPQHVIAMQLKDKNPNIEIIPMNGDAKALPVITINQIDVYITSFATISKWIDGFGFKEVIRIPANKTITERGVSMTNVAHTGLFMSKHSTEEQRLAINSCITKSIQSDEWKDTLKSGHVVPLDVSAHEKDKMVYDYSRLLNKYGL
jgi:tripartite-type tricarboxylate transporter receptor subunit TctC